MNDRLDHAALGQLFLDARSRNAWKEEVLPDTLWRELYDLVKFGPTSANVSPARFVVVTPSAGNEKLGPFLSETNRAKSLAAPAIVIIGHDLEFARRIPELFPQNPGAAAWFADPRVAETTAFRNGTLQGAYLILAARALGLDAGPMSGFDNAGVDAAFFAGTAVRSNFICALGHGVDTSWPRLPRLSFDDACAIV